MASLVSCSKIVVTHDLENEKPLLTMKPHNANINSVAWNHNSQVIASCGNDGKIVLSHAGKGSQLLTLEDQSSKTIPISSCSFTSNSQFLASGGNDGILKIWDLKKRSLGSSYKCHFGSITSVNWNSDDSLVASSSMIGDIVLHNIQYGTQVGNFTQKGSQGVKQIKFSPSKKNVLASAGVDGSVLVWDVNTRQTTTAFNGAHSARVNAVAYSTCNPVLLCSASLDQKINFYDISEKKPIKSLQCDAPLTSLGFHVDGHTIVAGTLYGGLYVYDLRASASVKSYLKGHDDEQVNYIDFIKPDESKQQSNLDEERENKVFNGEKPPIDITNQRKSSIGDISQKSNASDMIPQQPISGTSSTKKILPPSKLNTQENEPENTNSKFLDLEKMKKEVAERIGQKNAEKLSAGKLSIPKPNSNLNSSMKQDSERKQYDNFVAGIDKQNQFGNSNNNNNNSRYGSANKHSISAIEPEQKQPNNDGGKMHLENVNFSAVTNNTNRIINERIVEKTEQINSKIENSGEFSERQQEFLKDCFFDLQYNTEIETKLDSYFSQFNAVFQKYEEMRDENERLKKTSY